LLAYPEAIKGQRGVLVFIANRLESRRGANGSRLL
jgi:hypothetical protein